MVSNRGIEINPDKIKAIEEITVVNNVKAVQWLTWQIATLGRFISRLSEKSHHFFALLKRKNNFEWTPKMPTHPGRTKTVHVQPAFATHT